MNERAESLISALTQKYEAIRSLSDWSALKSVSDLDQMNALLDKRAILLREIAELPALNTVDPSALREPLKSRYVHLATLITEITDNDQWMAEKIAERMNEIREELKAKSLFRNRALPGYMRQKFALAG